jgi:hypothetical protein
VWHLGGDSGDGGGGGRGGGDSGEHRPTADSKSWIRLIKRVWRQSARFPNGVDEKGDPVLLCQCCGARDEANFGASQTSLVGAHAGWRAADDSHRRCAQQPRPHAPLPSRAAPPRVCPSVPTLGSLACRWIGVGPACKRCNHASNEHAFEGGCDMVTIGTYTIRPGTDDVDEFTIHGDLMDVSSNNCYHASSPAFHWEFTSEGHVRARGPSKQGGHELDNTYRNASHLHELIAKRIASRAADYMPTLFRMPRL